MRYDRGESLNNSSCCLKDSDRLWKTREKLKGRGFIPKVFAADTFIGEENPKEEERAA